ncbi:hypothetical protein [Xanthomonas hortorum]|uniref:hypothetical protein n=1 Tax=Xanthomonas hortorum TaxID=56454 RepID=UPI0015D5F2FF|nr:hypothetical protein [Xanthomonas hortorum]MCE4360474.1 hypothetical protein [Xanthomonas hortorum pv. taraxaci]NMI52967.1 hypothetical protein [Xanthomonas hortorum pv. taraxaci]CAD0305881.1 hypothetical protein NCPPB940_06740 [Xanthomonas hortorum pv. taraxaci]CAD0305891.1 hypothetical protein NCPPB940_06740 [Xanthomonas hortorum pv. taraxaci]
MSRPELELELPLGAQVSTGVDGFSLHCRRECAELGLSRVRLLLLDADDARSTAWREEAQRWMDEQLRREGQWVLRGVIAGIVLLAGAIALCAALLW